ncbi:transcriptional regulator family: Fungal Specific TF [Penicillium roqueforti]|nr:transcriptional regulator family: Fungal Specific TF [Penicillium roqueforti]KAI3171421.1 transcriptional regulator family: Fungal Specific TF [Penicillium roqueforti]KAI3192258.1 transcriptional regulator family: Fungal Specific TF [Penicillium roqueforti]
MDAPEGKARWASQRRAPRASRACETCRARKTKCDQAQPCSYCAYHSFDCVFRTSGGRGTPIDSNKRKRDIAESDQSQSSARPSPWPGIYQTETPKGTNDPEKSLPYTASSQAQSPSLLRGRPYAVNNPPRSTIPSARRSDASQMPNSEQGDAASRDGLSGVNLHTNGTEFYGNSSNLAFLGNLYARAQNQELRYQNRPDETPRQIPASPDYTNPQSQPLSRETSHKSSRRSGKSQLSIVNLLYNADYIGHPSPQSHDGTDFAAQRSPPDADGLENRTPPVNNDQDISLEALFPRLTEIAQMEIEKTFISSYFVNKHYIHPLLSKGTFMQRCENEAWSVPNRQGLFRGTTKFAGLYFAVVALGAINASSNETSLLQHFCQQFVDPSQTRRARGGPGFTALDFAKYFFGLAKRTLGDLFESSCLESAQSLLLLSVFRQNSLQPHSCYMYSGMAVRTAAAIGLGSSMSSLPPSARREARRTWWCIYSHEIEMCCSSGRLDSMKALHYYQTSLPKLKVDTDDFDPDAEDNDIAMIPAMVALAQIMSEASHQLYHSMRRSIADKSRLAMALDQRLLEWKATLPAFLDLDALALNDPEWAFKQKLVLRLRYYNTRILIHKPFLLAATANTDGSSPDLSAHLHTCLNAARMSINMQYESFMHRIYIRTWWYNTTYALYGSMILLHLILSNYPGLPDDELLEDVEKSLEIFSSMGDIIVARRCAEMLREVLEVARTCLARRRRSAYGANHSEDSQNQSQYSRLGVPYTSSSGGVSNSSQAAADATTSTRKHPIPNSTPTGGEVGLPAASFTPTHGLSLDTPSSIMDQHTDPEDGDFFFSLFSNDTQTQPDRTRAEMLANLVDPSVLEDFAFGGGNEFSFF